MGSVPVPFLREKVDVDIHVFISQWPYYYITNLNDVENKKCLLLTQGTVPGAEEKHPPSETQPAAPSLLATFSGAIVGAKDNVRPVTETVSATGSKGIMGQRAAQKENWVHSGGLMRELHHMDTW